MSQPVRVASGTVQRPSGHHMAPIHNPELDPSLHLPTALFPTPMPRDPCGSCVAYQRAAGTRALSAVRAPPGGWGCWVLNSALTIPNWRTEGRLCKISHRVTRSPGYRNGFCRSLQKDFPLRSSSPTFLGVTLPPASPSIAAACKACLAALLCTHCPWQLHRAGPRAQIMQPAQLPHQARLGGDLHQIREPPTPSPVSWR